MHNFDDSIVIKCDDSDDSIDNINKRGIIY